MADTKQIAEKKINQKYNELKKRRRDLGGKIGTIIKANHGAWVQVYAKGRIYSHHSVGTYEVHGSILNLYIARNEFNHNPRIGRREFGFPIADESKSPNGLHSMSVFEWGRIIALPGTYGGVGVSGNICAHWLGMGGGQSIFGYPINSNSRAAGGEIVFCERGLYYFDEQKEKYPFNISVNPPLLGNPAILKPDDKQFNFTINCDRTQFEKLGGIAGLAQIINNRYYLQQTGTTRRIPLGLQSNVRHTSKITSVNFSIPAANSLINRTLYDIVFRMDNGRYYPLSPHALYTKKSWDDFGLIHATDIHVARRIDGFRTKLKNAKKKYNRTDLENGIEKINNWNDRFRDLIRYANKLHEQGLLDGIIATGDIVDYLFEERDNKFGGGNFEFFKKLVLGKVKYPHKEATVEELKVPIFTTLGNHDYRINPYKLLAELSVFWGVINLKTIKQFDNYNINETEARAIQDGRPKEEPVTLSSGQIYEKEYGKPEIDKDAARKMVAIDKAPKYYLKYINRDFSYSVKLGQNRLLMLDAGHDVGTPDGILETLAAYTVFGSEDTKSSVLKGTPNTKGFVQTDLNLVAQALSEADGAIIIGTHSPPINTHGKEYPHYFRETEHYNADEKEVANYLRRRGEFPNHPSQKNYRLFTNDLIVKQVKKNFKDWPLNKTSYFKTGNHENYLDFGVSRGDYMKDFLKLCAGGFKTYGQNKINRAVDLVLFGHVHARVEMRIKWNKTLEYYHDFYTENPDKYYYSLKYTDKYGSFRGVSIQVDKDAKLNEKVDKENWRLKVPPYSDPLSATSNPTKWWEKHRPLFIQGAPLGPLDNNPSGTEPNFQGARLISVSNNVIGEIKQISSDEIAQVTEPNWLEPLLHIMMTPKKEDKWLEPLLHIMMASE